VKDELSFPPLTQAAACIFCLAATKSIRQILHIYQAVCLSVSVHRFSLEPDPLLLEPAGINNGHPTYQTTLKYTHTLLFWL